jgi:erythromycin esterase-like protein
VTVAERIARHVGVSAEAVGILRSAGESLPRPEDHEAFGAFFDRFGDARVVLLGEATHGTSEFYRARAATGRCASARDGRAR